MDDAESDVLAFIEQQSVLALHRVRQGFIKASTAQVNQIRGLLGEFGLIVPQGIGYITQRVPEIRSAPQGQPHESDLHCAIR